MAVNRRSFPILIALLLQALVGAFVAWWLFLDKPWLPAGIGQSGWFWITLIVALLVGGLGLRVARGFDWTEPIYFVAALFLLIFVARPIQIMLDPSWRSYFLPNTPQLLQDTLVLAVVGLTSFLVGYQIAVGSWLGKRLPVITGEWQRPRLLFVASVYLSVGLLGYYYAVMRAGGFYLFLSTFRGRLILAETNSWLFGALGLLIHVAALLLAAYYFKTGHLRGLFIFTLVSGLITSLFLGGRADALILFLAVTVTYYIVTSNTSFVRSTIQVLLLLVGIIVIVVIVARLRLVGLSGDDVLTASDTSVIFSATDVIDRFLTEFNQFDWFAITLDLVPDQLPYQQGRTFLSFFSFFIPSMLWPNKPLPISFVLNLTAGGAGAGSPPTILGEFYINFSVPGIILGMLLAGIIARAAYTFIRSNSTNLSAIVLYAYTFASIHRFFTRSFAPKLFGYLLFMIPTVLALSFVIGKRKGGSMGREQQA